MTGTFDKLQVKSVRLSALTTGGSDSFPFLKSPAEIGISQLIRAFIWTDTTIAGNVSNYFTVDVYNKTTSVVMASLATLTTNPIAADTWVPLVLSTTTANQKFAANDDLQVRVTQTSAGQALSALSEVLVHFWQGGQFSS